MKIVRATTKDGRVVLPAIAPTASPARKSLSAYPAAMVTRLSEDFPIAILSADAANRWSLRQLRARARDLERNGGIHNAYLNCLEADLIGYSGIGVHMKVRDDEDDRVITPDEQRFLKSLHQRAQAFRALPVEKKLTFSREARGDAFKAAVMRAAKETDFSGIPTPGGVDRYACFCIEQEWKEFSKRGNCDVTGKHSMTDLCRLTLRTSARDGDAILLVYLGYPNRWGLAFQLIEGDYLDDYHNVERLPNGNRIRMGVELDRFGRKVALWVFAHHPGDYGTDGVTSYGGRQRIAILGEPPDPYYTNGQPEAVQAIHITKSKRAEETRAVPWITSAMLLIHAIEKYKEAEITAAREEACKHIFYERDMFAGDGTKLEWETDSTGQLTDEMQPGGSTELPPGYKANFIDPKHPNENMPDFLKSMKREVAMSVNYCYNILFGDLESVNYSSLRGGLLQQREGSKMDQTWFGSDCFTPIVETFIRMALMAGALPFRMAEIDRLLQFELKFKRWPWVDPKNDAETAILLIQNRLRTRAQTIAEMSNEDFEETIDELDYEEGYIASKANLQPPTPAAAPALPVPKDEKEVEEEPDPEPQLPVKSAYMGDVAVSDLPEATRADIGRFQPHEPAHQVARYGMTVPELLAKADPHNLTTARHHVRNAGVAASSEEVHARRDKHILLLNDRIVDGHHHLAKAEKGKVTSSLPVLDLTPLRYQQAGAAESVKGAIDQLRDELGRYAADAGGGSGGGGGVRKWIDSVPALPEDTKLHHTAPGGGYTPERQQLHQAIRDKFLGAAQPVPDGGKPTAILMMGGPASGKTTIADLADDGNFVRVDADKVKKELPEYQTAVAQNARNAAGMAHEESSDVAKQIGAASIAARKNLIYDGTGANREVYDKLIGDLKEKGYHVKVVAAHLPVEDALNRVAIRADKEGRDVPADFIRDTYGKIPGNFAHNSSLAHEAELWDNSGEGSVLAASKAEDGKVTERNPRLLDKYGYR